MSEHRPSAEECLADIAAAGWAGHVAEIRMALAEADHDYRQLETDKDAEIARLSAIKDEAERIKTEAHLAGDHHAYDLMRTVLRGGAR